MDLGDELNEMIPRRIFGTIEHPNGKTDNIYTYKHRIDGVTSCSNLFSTSFLSPWLFIVPVRIL